MSAESMVAKEAVSAAQSVAKAAETAMRKAWSVLDAASEKTQPSKMLSDQAVRSIQGKVGG